MAWWKTSDLGECPITLESLNTLPYPPFLLQRNYFDGFALASFIVSRGVFQNPLTREDLTMEDCRRLDKYLEDYCYNNSASEDYAIGMTRRKVSVVEAFALRNSVQVETTGSSGASAEALRNAATSALVGLFVYGNDRRRRLYNQQPELTQQPSMDPLLSDWGFDLSRTVENTAQEGGHGYMVIDDDEANVVASQQTAYEAVQDAFPPLHENTESHITGVAAHGPDLDERFLEHMRTVSLQDQRKDEHRSRVLQQAREQILREALARREDRRKQRQVEREQNVHKHEQLKEEQAEIQMARNEIDAWRDEQWEKLRILSEQQTQKEEQRKSAMKKDASTNESNQRDTNVEPPETAPDGISEEELAAQKKKAKAAAKRKRARERKKEQKALEKEERDRREERMALEDQKAASKVKCDACGGGILDCGFEKLGKVFCSTKCARSAAAVAASK
ncbi:MAG: hypothetical protein SGILL_006211 [Bacillariaceae sp.]